MWLDKTGSATKYFTEGFLYFTAGVFLFVRFRLSHTSNSPMVEYPSNLESTKLLNSTVWLDKTLVRSRTPPGGLLEVYDNRKLTWERNPAVKHFVADTVFHDWVRHEILHSRVSFSCAFMIFIYL